MTSFGFASYIIAALFYGFFLLLLCTSWRGRLQGGLLVLAVLVSALWALAGAYAGKVDLFSLKHYLAIEVVRNLVWCAFLWHLLSFTRLDRSRHWLRAPVLLFAFLCLITVAMDFSEPLAAALNLFVNLDFRILSHVLQAVAGLVLVEQLYRNTRMELRWAIKFLCLGLGGLFAYDFVLYTESLLFQRIDPAIWDARGLVNALLVPLFAVSAARNPNWSVDIFISRTVVFHTTALLATGVYLLVSATIGYYIKEFGGNWGAVGQVVFIFGALLILLLLMFSGKIRASVKVFFNQHFFSYKYDYRKEWLQLNKTLAASGSTEQLQEGCIKALSDIVDSAGGLLWVRQEDGRYHLRAELNISAVSIRAAAAGDSLIDFMARRQWVVEIPEYEQTPELYEGLDLSFWQQNIPGLWLIVPLVKSGNLYGFIGLLESRAARKINWEDHDLLKTVGQQLANYLALMEASEELAKSRQFDAYNRLSAFVVHDLKNLVAQLSLVVKNAEKHRHNPAFIDDAMETLANSVVKMNKLLAQLRKGEVVAVTQRRVRLADALREAISQQNQLRPIPRLEVSDQYIEAITDADKLVAVLGHLIQNAQEATAEEGSILLTLDKLDNQAIINVQDTGRGMDAKFIRERLFRPFETTKGNAGMGIGVFETKQFVESQGGSIDVESKPGQGSKFTLRLPLFVAQEQPMDQSVGAEV